jgi:hypothetical protein
MEAKHANGDPVSATETRGKSNAQRKGRYDGSFTGTEQRIKNNLMRQFMRTGEGGGMGNSAAYRNSPLWCACGGMKVTGKDVCAKCDTNDDP